MKTIYKTIFLFAIAVSTSNCTKYIEFEGEDRPSELVLNGLMIADSVFAVELSLSRGYVDAGPLNKVENGIVEVFDEQGDLIETLDHTQEGLYFGNESPLAGHTYTVKARREGLNEINALDQVPPLVQIASWDTTGTDNENGQRPIDFTFTISDPGEVQNYYFIEFTRLGDTYHVIEYSDPESGETIQDTIYLSDGNYNFSTSDQILLSDVDVSLDIVDYSLNKAIFSDELFNGSTRTFTLTIEPGFNSEETNDTEFRLWSCSADYFNYLRTKERHDYSVNDPFSEPVQVFTNIEGGGFGIWAAASLDKIIF